MESLFIQFSDNVYYKSKKKYIYKKIDPYDWFCGMYDNWCSLEKKLSVHKKH